MSTPTQPPTETEIREDQRREDARQYVQGLRAFYMHAAVFAGTMIIIFLVNLFVNISAGITGEWWAWWSVWALLGWGIGITVHGLVVRMSRPRGTNSAWEEKQINKILASDGTESPQ